MILPKVLIIGGTTYDHIIHLPEMPGSIPKTIHECRFNEAVGSIGTGKALSLHKLGIPVHLISACGNDIYGEKIKEYLKDISCDLFIDEKGTERHVNIMDKEGKRISIFVTQSSGSIQLPENYMQKQLAAHDLIVLNIISYCRPWAEIVKNSKKPVWTDLHDYDGVSDYHVPFIDAAEFIHLSSDNLPRYREFMERMISIGKKLVVCTHAEKGASLLSPTEGWIEIDAPKICITDTNGAGDNFFSGFLFAYVQNMPLFTCLKAGTRAAALCIESPLIVPDKLSGDMLKQIEF